MRKIKVICGANSGKYEVEGEFVGSVRKNLRDVLNIPEGAKAKVKGKEVKETYNLKKGDTLEFIKPSGENGL